MLLEYKIHILNEMLRSFAHCRGYIFSQYRFDCCSDPKIEYLFQKDTGGAIKKVIFYNVIDGCDLYFLFNETTKEVDKHFNIYSEGSSIEKGIKDGLIKPDPRIIAKVTKIALNSIYGYCSRKIPKIKKVIFNDPATIVLWEDDTKTVVKAMEDCDIYDPEKGLAMAISKKALGNEGNYYNELTKWLDKYCDEHNNLDQDTIDAIDQLLSHQIPINCLVSNAACETEEFNKKLKDLLNKPSKDEE